MSLQAGNFPLEWKKSIVRPMTKKRPASQVSYFGKISILGSVPKILETVAK